MCLGIVVPAVKGTGDIRNCSWYRAVKFLEHRMKVVRKVLERRLHRIVTVNQMQFGFMLEKGTIDAVFILRRSQRSVSCKYG